jgi:murein DD-endopeptidase MepM/ murein hydrolase activator NlpD
MKIILLREKGSSRALRVSRQTVFVAALTLLVGMFISGIWLVNQLSDPNVENGTVSEWRERLRQQQLEVDRMKAETEAQSQAVGRQLAQMQARLLRMEALGARVTEIADLDQGEFSFADPAPQGGPLVERQDALAWPDLQMSLDELAAGLKARESELEILESMLRDQDYRKAQQVSGRPVTWGWMSSGFGKRVDPFSGKMAWHAGVDFAGKDGSEVVSVASGVVTHAGKRSGYGQMVEVNHGGGYVTRYGHHASLLVKVGDIVKKGQPIGTMGSSGRSTGPHVHFEVLKDGQQVDPARYVARRR